MLFLPLVCAFMVGAPSPVGAAQHTPALDSLVRRHARVRIRSHLLSNRWYAGAGIGALRSEPSCLAVTIIDPASRPGDRNILLPDVDSLEVSERYPTGRTADGSWTFGLRSLDTTGERWRPVSVWALRRQESYPCRAGLHVRIQLDDDSGVVFFAPQEFLRGRFATRGLADAVARRQRRTVVLVLRPDLDGHPLNDLPPGGAVPAIWVARRPGPTTALGAEQPVSTWRVGDAVISRHRNTPGLDGRPIDYYLLRWPDGFELELAAHRFRLRGGAREPTDFAAVIERMIPSVQRVTR